VPGVYGAMSGARSVKRSGWGRRLAAWASDYLWAAWWQIRGIGQWRGAQQLTTGADPARPAVVVVPGVYEPWGFMRPEIGALRQAGYAVHVVDTLGYNTGEIPAAARMVAEYLAGHDLGRVVLVAHSKGGLIGKYLMARHDPERRVERLVTVATPFAGSAHARWLPVRAVREFLPTAVVLRELAREQAMNGRIVSIFGTFDPHIPGGSRLEGARNVELPVMGHFRILRDRRVVQAVVRAVEAGATRSGGRRSG
jgi:triacylglycerol lipase